MACAALGFALEIDTQMLSEDCCLPRRRAIGIVLREFSAEAWFVSQYRSDAIRLDLSMDWRVLLFTDSFDITCVIFGCARISLFARDRIGLKSGIAITAGPERFRFSGCWLYRS